MGINVSRQTAALIATVVIVAVGLLVFSAPARPSDRLTLAVRTPTNYDPTRTYPLLVVFPPAGFNRRQSETFYDLTTEATRRGFIVAYRPPTHLPGGRRSPPAQAADERRNIERAKTVMV